jgi:hypothetical protein
VMEQSPTVKTILPRSQRVKLWFALSRMDPLGEVHQLIAAERSLWL